MEQNQQIMALVGTYLNLLVEDSTLKESSDESDCEDIINLVKMRRERIPKVRIVGYVENVVPRYSDADFKSHVRLNRCTFLFLLELLSPQLTKQCAKIGRNTINPEKTLLLAIWTRSTPNSYRCVADRFNIGKATAWRCVQKVVNALYSHIHMFITWPDRAKAEKTWTYIENRFKFPKVLGAIDGTHIKIAAPKLHSDAYINRKGYHSIQLQIICDHELKITHVYAGQVGSVHDMRVFRLSGFESMCTENNFPENSHILGDAAYTIHKNLMVPFKNNGRLSNAQNYYNTRLSQSRMMVERTIGLLKGRFRSLLDILPMRRTDLIPKYICACCILHNICLIKDDHIDIPIVVQANEPVREAINDVPQPLRTEGIEKRNAIVNYLQNLDRLQ